MFVQFLRSISFLPAKLATVMGVRVAITYFHSEPSTGTLAVLPTCTRQRNFTPTPTASAVTPVSNPRSACVLYTFQARSMSSHSFWFRSPLCLQLSLLSQCSWFNLKVQKNKQNKQKNNKEMKSCKEWTLYYT